MICFYLFLVFIHEHCAQIQQQQQRHANDVEMLPVIGAAGVVLNNNHQIINIEAIQQQLQQHQQQIPALLAAYHAMPQILFMAIDQQRDDCAICLDPIPLETFVRPLPCNHIFHNDCIENWYGSNHETCPLCRRDPDQNNIGTANGPN
ncbi:hypothetical protein niasHT_012944 [Heterodera trifolii]|uniref:RING-type domain-containing protein n=1 Tax=Heterodera trifolii TaxID=157864 RepID=A0ABD2L7J6_9BILA